jgi:hypothetical protein
MFRQFQIITRDKIPVEDSSASSHRGVAHLGRATTTTPWHDKSPSRRGNNCLKNNEIAELDGRGRRAAAVQQEGA